MSSSLLASLQSAEAAGDSAAVHALLTHMAPQLLQLEQQVAVGAQSEPSALQLQAWVAAYCTSHEKDDIRANAAATAAHSDQQATTAAAAAAPRSASSGAVDASASASAAASSAGAPAPLFFYLLCHGAASRCLALQYLSALFTDPATDQDFYWLNDAQQLVRHIQAKLHLTQQRNKELVQHYALTKTIGQRTQTNNTRLHRSAWHASKRA